LIKLETSVRAEFTWQRDPKISSFGIGVAYTKQATGIKQYVSEQKPSSKAAISGCKNLSHRKISSATAFCSSYGQSLSLGVGAGYEWLVLRLPNCQMHEGSCVFAKASPRSTLKIPWLTRFCGVGDGAAPQWKAVS